MLALLFALLAGLAVFGFNRSANAQTATDEPQGTFTATLGSLNTSANGGTAVTGTATFVVSGDTFTATVDAHGLAPSMAHAMHIHTGNACPAPSADTNHDGVIDVVEGVPAYGPILIPIDNAITSQATGDFPMSDASGNLHFTTSGSLTALLADLHAADPDTTDAVAKLKPNEMLNLAMRHVVVHGVAGSVPATAQSIGGLPAAATLPVACGTISASSAATPSATATTTATPGQPSATAPAEQQGSFVATLGALNTSANGGTAVSGSVTFTITGDNITAVVNARGLAPNMAHAMHIHTGNACPAPSADTNGDGVIDVIEGVPTYGPILVPIDTNLASQADGDFPKADANGNIQFTTRASLSALLADLHAADPDTSDAVAKLKPNEALNLIARHVVIHGVAGSVPSTAQSIAGLSANATLPVACGAITASTMSAPNTGTGIAADSGSSTGMLLLAAAGLGLIVIGGGATAAVVRTRR
jgi:Cu/Zn superoxide dismutase